eukprot:6372361-Pyramimonas_sp.AAC.1
MRNAVCATCAALVTGEFRHVIWSGLVVCQPKCGARQFPLEPCRLRAPGVACRASLRTRRLRAPCGARQGAPEACRPC